METIFGVFAKQPISGRVKTRLAMDIGADAAATIYEAFLRDITQSFAGIADRCVIGHSGADENAEAYFDTIADGQYELWAQPDASLGERMGAFFVEHLTEDSAVVLIGSDSPTLPVPLIEMAFVALQQDDCVIGPAPDGGYYLIGLRRWVDGLFDDIEWDGANVLVHTVRNLTTKEYSLQLLPPWYDVDTIDDLYGLRGHLTALRAAGWSDVAPLTWDAVQSTMDKSSQP
ncbi:MAG: TIGR04282 family arsenosugar biosynthesis glycosyltransferase [Planctomycetaceae bacterium]|nr:TIGR04282 family arsenosugar biosynthesis glycosyltransferase [Planctomycetaceae bacterium]